MACEPKRDDVHNRSSREVWHVPMLAFRAGGDVDAWCSSEEVPRCPGTLPREMVNGSQNDLARLVGMEPNVGGELRHVFSEQTRVPSSWKALRMDAGPFSELLLQDNEIVIAAGIEQSGKAWRLRMECREPELGKAHPDNDLMSFDDDRLTANRDSGITTGERKLVDNGGHVVGYFQTSGEISISSSSSAAPGSTLQTKNSSRCSPRRRHSW